MQLLQQPLWAVTVLPAVTFRTQRWTTSCDSCPLPLAVQALPLLYMSTDSSQYHVALMFQDSIPSRS
jgi:hypothetical protein